MQCDRNMVMRPHSSELDALDSLHQKSPVQGLSKGKFNLVWSMTAIDLKRVFLLHSTAL